MVNLPEPYALSSALIGNNYGFFKAKRNGLCYVVDESVKYANLIFTAEIHFVPDYSLDFSKDRLFYKDVDFSKIYNIFKYPLEGGDLQFVCIDIERVEDYYL